MSKPRRVVLRFALRFALHMLAVSCVGNGLLHASRWEWPVSFSAHSSEGLVKAHEQLLAPSIEAGQTGIPVTDLVWESEFARLKLSGVIYLEPGIQGVPVGAFFVGSGRLDLAPPDPRAQHQIAYWFGTPALREFEFGHAYFFTLRGENLARQLGIDETGSEPFDARERYLESKQVMRVLGARLVHSFLNRNGRSGNTAHVVLAANEIRGGRSEHAYMVYSFDPSRIHRVEVSVTGHDGIPAAKPEELFLRPIFQSLSGTGSFHPHGRVKSYKTHVSVRKGARSAEQDAVIEYVPDPGAHALMLDFTSRMTVHSIIDGDGAPLAFLQWEHDKGGLNLDEHLVVEIGAKRAGRAEEKLVVKSAGSLFEPFYNMHWLAEEDIWHPRLDDPVSTNFELYFTVPNSRRAVGIGELVAEEVRDGRRHYHFQTARPRRRATLYYGDFWVEKIGADDTVIEFYDDAEGSRAEQANAAAELASIVRFYNHLFGPLGLKTLRVATIPTNHGRDFEGLILLGQGALSDSWRGDFFRAREVAHQWWGNIVQPKSWPRDRWLSEAFAEYAAMEYNALRPEEAVGRREQIYWRWFFPLTEGTKSSRKLLTGRNADITASERFAVLDGRWDVETKGPMVLHMLRYMFQLQRGNDEAFWEMLRSFLQQYRYRQASTEDFISLAEQHLGSEIDWFWEQWLHGTKIPILQWESLTERSGGGKWAVTVRATQDTDFTLVVPMYAHFGGGRFVSRPLLLQNKTAEKTLILPEKPKKITLNDGHESLVIIRH